MIFFEDYKISSDVLKKMFTPAILILGTFGNVISIKIFTKDSMKKYSTFRYLTLLSIIDLCTLYTGCGQILLDVFFNIDIRLLNNFVCKLQSFLVYFFTHFSSMLLAVMSIDRTLSIMSRRANKRSTPETALKAFYLLGLMLAAINFHFILFTTLIDYEVQPNDLNDSYHNSTIQVVKFCYAPSQSAYFLYISQIFPW